MQLASARWTLGTAFLVVVLYGCGQGTSAGGGGSGSGGGSGGSGGSSGGSGGASSGLTGSTGATSGAGGSGGGTGSGSGVSSSGSGSSGTSSGSGGSGAHSGSSSSGQDAGLQADPPLTAAQVMGMTATLISGQFYFTEGPVWDPNKNVLYFTDIQAHQGSTNGGAIYQLTLPNTISVFFQPDGNADGIGLDPQGNIIAAGFASRNIWRLSNGAMQTLAACSSSAKTSCYNGQEVNTPDDITSRSDGVIYFTDPTFGSGQGLPTQSFAPGMTQGVYSLTKDGMVHQYDSTSSGPNGVNLSPDEKTLYVAYTLGNSVSKFNVATDGSLSGKANFATGTSLADSMCVDRGGNVYVGTQPGLAVFSPSGAALGTISAGGQIVTNCAFGGPDQRTLFITSRGSGTLIGTPVANDSALYKVDNMPVRGIPGQN
jgi:gluconolactonase